MRRIAFLLPALLAISSTLAEDPVYFADPNLKAAVEEELGPDPTPTDMLTLTDLDAESRGITNLTGLEYATNLEKLDLRYNQITDINALSNLTNLWTLYLYDNQITDISALSGLTELQYLWLVGNPLNTATYCVYLPLIAENNPGIDLRYDAIETFACDCDGDGFVDFDDFAMLADNWWEIDCGGCEWIDSDGDGDVDFDDLMILSGHWLQEWESIE